MEGKIYEAISNVMKDVGAVGKNDTNPNQHYKYRGIDAVMNALNPAMIKNKIFVVPDVIDQQREEREGRNGGVLIYSVIKVKYTFYTTDGSNVESVVIGEAMDSGDKSMNKAMSAAFKYACFQTFCIPTEEMIDSESESPEPAPKKEKKIENIGDMKISAAKVNVLAGDIETGVIDRDKLLKWFKVEKLEDITEAQFREYVEKRDKRK